MTTWYRPSATECETCGERLTCEVEPLGKAKGTTYWRVIREFCWKDDDPVPLEMDEIGQRLDAWLLAARPAGKDPAHGPAGC